MSDGRAKHTEGNLVRPRLKTMLYTAKQEKAA